ncbi:hypothetical protein BaRGS_00001123 [Batillaria attramentaria]|uniref:Uncharacterized protein n=1 Tax=Batillaria attramentaria TaxID=370345 RepID=A0ABD0M607_9CAEN
MLKIVSLKKWAGATNNINFKWPPHKSSVWYLDLAMKSTKEKNTFEHSQYLWLWATETINKSNYLRLQVSTSIAHATRKMKVTINQQIQSATRSHDLTKAGIGHYCSGVLYSDLIIHRKHRVLLQSVVTVVGQACMGRRNGL